MPFGYEVAGWQRATSDVQLDESESPACPFLADFYLLRSSNIQSEDSLGGVPQLPLFISAYFGAEKRPA